MPRISKPDSRGTAPNSQQPELRPYQVDGIEWLRTEPRRGLLADEPGLGKSRQLIEASQGRTLVVAPAMVLDGGTWDEEIALWADDPARFTCTPYSMLNDRVKTAKGGTKPVDRLREQFRGKWDTVILDEAHYIKGRKTSWSKAARKIKTDATYLATGTPFPNWADEMFVPLQMLYPEESGRGERFGSFWRWAEEWFDCSPTRFSQGNPVVGELLGCEESCLARPATDPCEHYLTFAEVNLGQRFLQRLRDDVLPDLPPLTQQVIRVPMLPAQRKIYDALDKDFIAWGESGEEVVAWTDSALHVKLDKVSTGLEVAGAGHGSAKFERLVWDLMSRSRPTLVVGHYQPTLEGAQEYLAQHLPSMRTRVVHGGTARAARSRYIAEFKAGQVDTLLGSLETVSEGLTLTAADMVIFLEKSYKPYRNTQALRRIHRLGQTRPVHALFYFTPGADEGKWRLVETKTDRQIRHLSAAALVKALRP